MYGLYRQVSQASNYTSRLQLDRQNGDNKYLLPCVTLDIRSRSSVPVDILCQFLEGLVPHLIDQAPAQLFAHGLKPGLLIRI